MIDTLINQVRTGLSEVPDHRMAAGNLQYSLIDNLMAGFAIFSLKDSSLLEFRELIKERQENLRRIYGLDKIPQDSALRQTLDGVQPQYLQGQYRPLIDFVKGQQLWEGRKVLQDYHAVSIDATGYFSSSSTCCDQPRKLNERLEAQITSIACSTVPEGSARWTLRLINDKLVELGFEEKISNDTPFTSRRY